MINWKKYYNDYPDLKKNKLPFNKISIYNHWIRSGKNERRTLKIHSKFLIYRATGGLTHMLSGLYYCLYLCNISKRILIIDTHNHKGVFGDIFSKFFKINNYHHFKYYDTYSVIPDNYRWNGKNIHEIKNTPFDSGVFYSILNINITKNKYNQVLSDTDICIYAGSHDLRFIFNTNINIQINNNLYEKLTKEQPIKEKYISIHFRNTDIKNNFTNFKNKLQNLIRKTLINTVYIASDDSDFHNQLKTSFPKINFTRKTIPSQNISNLHYSHPDKFQQNYELFRDIYYILKSNYFIPSYNSGLSKFIILMIKNKKYIIQNISSETIIIQ